MLNKKGCIVTRYSIYIFIIITISEGLRAILSTFKRLWRANLRLSHETGNFVFTFVH